MLENFNKMAASANFFKMQAFTYNRNQFFEAYIIYLYAMKSWRVKMTVQTATKSLSKSCSADMKEKNFIIAIFKAGDAQAHRK